MSIIGRLLGAERHSTLDLRWLRRGGWLGEHLTGDVPPAPRKRQIERAAADTNQLGEQRLAEEYGEPDGTRTPDVVRSSSANGDLFAWLVGGRRPDVVVEFGSAFGVSGMYFCAGLEANQHGHLYSFEINRDWAAIAERNIRTISDRVTLTRGAFEECVDSVLTRPIDLALVDGIHTYEFVLRQFAILAPRMSRAGTIMFDDIDFARPRARMRDAWEEIAALGEVAAAVEIRGRVGVVELLA